MIGCGGRNVRRKIFKSIEVQTYHLADIFSQNV